MAEHYHGVVGYLDNDPDDDFSFLIPLFIRDNLFYRYTADESSGTITAFTQYEGAGYIPCTDLPEYKVTVGSPAIYLIRYGENIRQGNKPMVSALLLKLIKRYPVDVFDEYNIQTFVGILPNISESVLKIIQAFPGIGLAHKNFYLPKTRLANLNSLRNSLVFYADIMDRTTRSMLAAENLFPVPSSDDHVQFNDLLIPLPRLHSWREELLSYKVGEPRYYKELVYCLLGILSATDPYTKGEGSYPIQMLVSTRVKAGRNFIKLYANMAPGNEPFFGNSFDGAWGLESEIEHADGDLEHGAENGMDNDNENDRINRFAVQLTKELS